MAVYFALLEPGDTVLGMELAHGGHLTHGANVNFSGKLYNFVPYGVDKDTELIDYDEIERLAREHRPKLIVAGCSAYAKILDFPRFRAIADAVDAYLMVDMAHIAGLIAGGAHPSPFPHAHVVTSTTQKRFAGAAGRVYPVHRGPGPQDRLCRLSLYAGWAADARHRGQGGLLWRGPQT